MKKLKLVKKKLVIIKKPKNIKGGYIITEEMIMF